MINITADSRTDYFKKCRKDYKAFHVEVECDKMEKFEEKLSMNKTTKKQWYKRKS